MMHICVFGAGSLGSALAGMLAAHNPVTIVGRRTHVVTVRRRGLAMIGDVRRTVRVVAWEKADGLDPPELLIITTKSYDTSDAIDSCRTFASRNTQVLTLQNGLGNLELIRSWKGSNAFAGTTSLGANLVAPGRVRISGLGKTVIGSDLNPAGASKIGDVFNRCGLPTRTEPDVASLIWSKVAVSAAVNPLTAVMRVQNGKLLENRTLARMMKEVCTEAVEVGQAAGAQIDLKKTFKLVRSIAADTANNRSSMLQDVERGRRTEIEQINGAIWRLGERLGVPAPLNKSLWAMVSSMTSSQTSQKA